CRQPPGRVKRAGMCQARSEPAPGEAPSITAMAPSHNPPPDRAPPALLSRRGHALGWATILLAALLWRLMGITLTEVWRDEATTLIHTQAGWLDLIRRLPFVEDTPPLSFLMFKAWSSL